MFNAQGPTCPGCGAWITKVVLTKQDSECQNIIRRRHCEYCDHRFYTSQSLEQLVDVKWTMGLKQTIPKVVKVHETKHRRRVA